MTVRFSRPTNLGRFGSAVIRCLGVTVLGLWVATAPTIGFSEGEIPMLRGTIYEIQGVDQGSAEFLVGASLAALYIEKGGELILLTDERIEGLWTGARQGSRLLDAAQEDAEDRLAKMGNPVHIEEEASTLRFRELALQRMQGTPDSNYILKLPSVIPIPAEIGSHGVAGEKTTGWVIQEGFESSPWQRWMRSDETSGAYTWERTTCDSYDGSYSVDAVRGGNSGSGLSCNADYPNNATTWLWDGQCEDIQGASAAWLSVFTRLDMDDGDKLSLFFAGPDDYLYGWVFRGRWSPWWRMVFNLRQWPSLGDLTNIDCNQLFFRFLTDGSSKDGFGVRLDEVEMFTEFSPTLGCAIGGGPLSGSAPLRVSFTADVISLPGADLSYSWTFADGASSSQADPVHTFVEPGEYDVILAVTEDASRCLSMEVVTVTEGGSCTVNCSATVPSSTTVGETTPFRMDATLSDCSGGPNYSWTFGDGGSSTQRVASHAYDSAGTFTWTGRVTADGISCTRQRTINVRAPSGEWRALAPSVAHLDGTAGTQWRTDLALSNRNQAAADVTLTFLSDSGSVVRHRTIGAHTTVEMTDVLVSEFGVPTTGATAGSIEVLSNQGLVAGARTYNQTSEGTFGQYIPVLTEDEALLSGETGVLSLLRKDRNFRTNVGMVNLGSGTCSVEVRLVGSDGVEIGDPVVLIADARRWVQKNDVFAAARAGMMDGVIARVRVMTPGGKAWVYGSVIDNDTGDPTTVPMQVVAVAKSDPSKDQAQGLMEIAEVGRISASDPGQIAFQNADRVVFDGQGEVGLALEWGPVVASPELLLGLDEPRHRILIDDAVRLDLRSEESNEKFLGAIENPIAVAAVDLNEDAMPEVILLGRIGEGAALTVAIGNQDFLFPNSPEAVVRREEGEIVDGPFRPEGTVIPLDWTPKWMAVGDVTADGRPDVVLAGPGRFFFEVFAGDGKGGLSVPVAIAAPSRITALAVGAVNRTDGIDDVVVGFDGAEGRGLAVYESPGGSSNAVPEIIALSQVATAIAIAPMVGDVWNDIAALCGDSLMVVHGRDRRLGRPGYLEVPRPTVTEVELPAIGVTMTPWDAAGSGVMEIAVLLEDGTVRLIDAQSDLRADFPVVAAATPDSATRLVTGRLSGFGRGDLMILDPAAGRLRVRVPVEGKALQMSMPRLETVDLEVSGAVVGIDSARFNLDPLADLVLAVDGLAGPAISLTKVMANFVVNDSGDEEDDDSGDGVCRTEGGSCTLRAALGQALALDGGVAITFSVTQVNVGRGMPPVWTGGTVDGSAHGLVEIRGPGEGENFTCLVVNQPATVRNLALNGCANGGIEIGYHDGQRVEGCAIGYRRDGQTRALCGKEGIDVDDECDDVVIGGPNGNQANQVAGCEDGIELSGSNVLVQGNRVSECSDEGNHIAGGITKAWCINCDATGTATIVDNVLESNEAGITLSGDDDEPVLIQGNQIIDSTVHGVIVASGGVTIGGPGADQGNEILGSAQMGIWLPGSRPRNTVIQGNTIGEMGQVTGQHGIWAQGDADSFPSDATIGGLDPGMGNWISRSFGHGVLITHGERISVLGNSIEANNGLGIAFSETAGASTPNDQGDSDDGPNGLQNHPIIEVGGNGVTVSLQSKASQTFWIEVFSNTVCDPSGFGEGEVLVAAGNLTTNAQGRGEVFFTVTPDQGAGLAATATDAAGNTSEFGPCTEAGEPMTITPSVAVNSTECMLFEQTITATISGEGFVDDSRTRVELRGSQPESPTASVVGRDNCNAGYCSQLTVDLTGLRNLEEGARDVVVIAPDGSEKNGRGLFYVSSLVVKGIEINQSLPSTCVAPNLPCVADHNAAVRIRMTCHGDECELGKGNAVGWLYLEKNGSQVPWSPILPEDPVTIFPDSDPRIDLATYAGIDRFNWFLDTAGSRFTAGSWNVIFEVDPRNPAEPPDVSGPEDDHNLVFRLDGARFRRSSAAKALKMLVVVEGTEEDRAGAHGTFEFLRDVYPISRDQVSWVVVPAGNLGMGEHWAFVKVAHALAEYNHQNQSAPLTHAVLLTHDRRRVPTPGVANCFARGSGSNRRMVCNSAVSLMQIRGNFTGVLMAHETGHHLGLGDTYTSVSGTYAAANNPGAECRLLGNGCPVEDLGLDLELLTASVPILGASFTKRDFMGNASRRSDTLVDRRTWDHLHSVFFGGKAEEILAMAVTGPWILVSGLVEEDGSVAVIETLTGDDDPPLVPEQEGDWSVRLVGGSGQVLSEAFFDPSFDLADSANIDERGLFSVLLSHDVSATRMVVRDGSSVVGSKTISANPPTVRVISPNGGENLSGTTTVRWQASDADGDSLTATVFFSRDGGPWNPVAFEVAGSSVVWNTAESGGTSNGRVRVVVSDGVHRALDDSNSSFSVAEGPPSAAILSPADGAFFEEGTDIWLQGVVHDPENGVLDDSRLRWRSSLDGLLGTGAEKHVVLSTGKHRLTLTGEDGTGATGSADLWVHVGEQALAYRYVVPAIAHAPGVGGTSWRTDVGVAGPVGATAGFRLRFSDGDQTLTSYQTLTDGGSAVWRNLLESLLMLGVDDRASGTLEVASTEPLALASRTYNQTPDGTFGQYLPGLEVGEGFGPGEAGVLSPLESSADFRSNIGVVNLGSGQCAATIRLFVAGGAAHGDPVYLSVAPGQWRQINDIFAAANADVRRLATATVEGTGAGCRLWAYASVVDNRTGDPTTVPVIVQ